MDSKFKTIAELEFELGQRLKELRLSLNLDQVTVAEGADVSLTAIKRLEGGKGATLKTMIKVVRYLGQTEWLEALSPVVSISPLQMAKKKPARQRASSPRTKEDAK